MDATFKVAKVPFTLQPFSIHSFIGNGYREYETSATCLCDYVRQEEGRLVAVLAVKNLTPVTACSMHAGRLELLDEANINVTYGPKLLTQTFLIVCQSNPSTPVLYCFLTQSGHPVSKWALFNFAVYHSKFVALLFSGIYVLSDVLVVHHGNFKMQGIFSIFLKTTIIKSAHFETGCPL